MSIASIQSEQSTRFKNVQNLAPFDGELYLFQAFYLQPESDSLFAELQSSLAWQEEDIFIFGKWVKVPRLMCWYGDADSRYRYSGVTHEPKPWNSVLQSVREDLEQYCRCQFNSVLANFYRNGNDSMGRHADDEKELGPNPLIASLSLGDERVFRLHHKKRNETLDIRLGHGDLLVMAGSLQHHWQHSIPKTRQYKGPRINLTFRKIFTV